MKINISGLSTGFHTFDVAENAGRLGLPGNFTGDVTVHVDLEKTSWQIIATIRAAVNATLQCDRCAEDFTSPIEVSFDAVYSWEDSDRSGAEDDNFFLLAEGQKEIDLSDPVREYLMLAVPIKNLCREDCRGLCPVCGTNRNEHTCTCVTEAPDSRWDALQKLASRKK